MDVRFICLYFTFRRVENEKNCLKLLFIFVDTYDLSPVVVHILSLLLYWL